MKQMVVIRVALDDRSVGCSCWGIDDDNKRRRKAMKIVVGVKGVESAALRGMEMDEIEAIGEGIDAVSLVSLLRKNFGHAMLLTAGPLEIYEDTQTETAETNNNNQENGGTPTVMPVVWPYTYNYPPYHIYQFPTNQPSCSIF